MLFCGSYLGDQPEDPGPPVVSEGPRRVPAVRPENLVWKRV